MKLWTCVTLQKEALAGCETPYANYSMVDLDGIHRLSSLEIIEEYYSYWSKQMIKKGGISPLINTKNCIEDWCILHWAQYN